MSEIQFCCDICDCTYTTQGNYNTHLKSKKHKKIFDALYICEICDKKFTNKYNYTRHTSKIHKKPSKNNIDNDNSSIVDNNRTSAITQGNDSDLLKVIYDLKHKNELQEERHKNELLEKEIIIKNYEKEMYKQLSEIHEKGKIFAQDIARTSIKTLNTAVIGLTDAEKYRTDTSS